MGELEVSFEIRVPRKGVDRAAWDTAGVAALAFAAG